MANLGPPSTNNPYDDWFKYYSTGQHDYSTYTYYNTYVIPVIKYTNITNPCQEIKIEHDLTAKMEKALSDSSGNLPLLHRGTTKHKKWYDESCGIDEIPIFTVLQNRNLRVAFLARHYLAAESYYTCLKMVNGKIEDGGRGEQITDSNNTFLTNLEISVILHIFCIEEGCLSGIDDRVSKIYQVFLGWLGGKSIEQRK